MSVGSKIAAQILHEQEVERQAEARRRADAIAAGPPIGSRIGVTAWAHWHRYGFHSCPGEKRDVSCARLECGIGASCAKMAAKGLHGDGAPMERLDRPACGAKTRAGGECAMRVEPGKHRCRLHGGLSTGPRTEEGRQRLSEKMRALWAAKKAGVVQ